MATNEVSYTLSLSGDDGSNPFKERIVSEQLALKIIALVMSGSTTTVENFERVIFQNSTGNGASIAAGVDITPKAFMAEKKPASEIERLTCLAYYLSHNRNMNAFKTRDLTKLNTEAAQPNFSNPTVFARNADTAGFLSKAGGGSKQITALGEKVVEAMPDREKVKTAITDNRVGSRRRSSQKHTATKK